MDAVVGADESEDRSETTRGRVTFSGTGAGSCGCTVEPHPAISATHSRCAARTALSRPEDLIAREAWLFETGRLM